MGAPGPGSRIGPYLVTRVLGAGTMGLVLEAVEPGADRQVAIKLLLHSDRATHAQLERFRREREALAAINHPHVVRVHAAGSHQGTPYLVTELLPGRTLRQLGRGEAQPFERAIDWTLQLARGLGALHAAGLIHRDVKPDNVLVDERGALKLADLGLAHGEEDPRLTETGVLLGTPEYMSPEALLGRLIRSPAADVYSVGVILFELLCGRLPHPAGTLPALLFARSQRPQVDPRELRPDVPPALAAVCLRALAGDPAQRFPDGQALASALEGLRLGAAPVPRSGGGLVALLALALAGAGGAILILRAQLLPSERPPPRESAAVSSTRTEAAHPRPPWRHGLEAVEAARAGLGAGGPPARAALARLEERPIQRWEVRGTPRVEALAGDAVAWRDELHLRWEDAGGAAGQLDCPGAPGPLRWTGEALFALVGGTIQRIGLEPPRGEPLASEWDDVRALERVGSLLLIARGEQEVVLLAPDGARVGRWRIGQPGERVLALTGSAPAPGRVLLAALTSAPDDPGGVTSVLTRWEATPGGPEGGNLLLRQPLPTARVMAFAPGGRLLAVGGSDGGVLLVSSPEAPLTRLPASAPERAGVRGLAWSQDGRRLYAAVDPRASSGQGITVWDVPRARPLRAFGGREYRGLRLSPDGRSLVAARPGAVEVWSVSGDAWDASGQAQGR